VIPVRMSSVNRVRNNMGCDAAFRRSMRTFVLFSVFLSFERAVVRISFFRSEGPSSESLDDGSRIVFRER